MRVKIKKKNVFTLGGFVSPNLTRPGVKVECPWVGITARGATQLQRHLMLGHSMHLLVTEIREKIENIKNKSKKG